MIFHPFGNYYDIMLLSRKNKGEKYDDYYERH